jgi:uncharacterized cofD-like protein
VTEETASTVTAAADGPRVVALGGGHGLAASLAALRMLTERLTAVVTVADDGGSSGRIRRELSAVPPGDLRMALATLAGDDEWGRTWGDLLQYRFGGTGALAGHPVGNLLLTGLAELTGDTVAALDLTGRLLGAIGRVLPMSTVPLEIVAEVAGIDDDPMSTRLIRGQVAVATTPGRVLSVSVVPRDPPACGPAVQAVRDADFVVLGPGSWFTSVLPHLLVPELAEALAETRAQRVVALNLAPQAGETDGFSPETHLDVLCAHAPKLRIDAVVADAASTAGGGGLAATVRRLGARLVLAPVAAADGTARHDPRLLAEAYRQVFGGAMM